MSDTAAKFKGKAGAANFEAKAQNGTFEAKAEAPSFAPKFPMPSMEVPAAFRDLAERSLSQVKDGYDKMKSVTEETTGLIEDTYAAAAKGSSEYGLKVIEAARANTNAAFDYARALLSVKTLSEIVEVSTAHSRKQFEATSEQARELVAIAQKVAAETAEPMKSGMTKAFSKVA